MNPEDFAERWAAEQERRYQAQMEAADMRQEAAEAHAAREVSFTEREEFEAWWMLSPMTSNKRPARLPDGQYANSLADHAWNGWQGRAAATIDLTEGMLEKVAAPDGWKLVPVEVTPEMEAAYYDPRKGVGAAAEWGAMLDAAPNVDAPMMGMAPPATAPVVLPEPDSYLFQHEDTGQTMFVDAQQVEWGFEANNPRLHKVSGVYTEQQVRELLAAQNQQKPEPFGYFKAEPFGWTDCSETDEGAIALYEAPQPQADALDTERLDWLIAQGCSHGVVYEGPDKSFWMVWLDGHDAHKDKHQIGRYHTAREAIDAAIAASKEKAK